MDVPETRTDRIAKAKARLLAGDDPDEVLGELLDAETSPLKCVDCDAELSRCVKHEIKRRGKVWIAGMIAEWFS